MPGGGAWPASSSSSARVTRWASAGRIAAAVSRRAPRQLGVQGGRAVLLELRPAARADLGGDGRAEVELRERRAQVEAGAADDDRAPALGQQRVDLGVGGAGELAGARGRGQRQRADEAVLEPLALGRAWARR